MLNKGEITKDSVVDILVDMERGSFNISKYEKVDVKEIEEEITKLKKKNLTDKAMMGILMGKFKGRISGKELMEIIKRSE